MFRKMFNRIITRPLTKRKKTAPISKAAAEIKGFFQENEVSTLTMEFAGREYKVDITKSIKMQITNRETVEVELVDVKDKDLISENFDSQTTFQFMDRIYVEVRGRKKEPATFVGSYNVNGRPTLFIVYDDSKIQQLPHFPTLIKMNPEDKNYNVVPAFLIKEYREINSRRSLSSWIDLDGGPQDLSETLERETIQSQAQVGESNLQTVTTAITEEEQQTVVQIDNETLAEGSATNSETATKLQLVTQSYNEARILSSLAQSYESLAQSYESSVRSSGSPVMPRKNDRLSLSSSQSSSRLDDLYQIEELMTEKKESNEPLQESKPVEQKFDAKPKVEKPVEVPVVEGVFDNNNTTKAFYEMVAVFNERSGRLQQKLEGTLKDLGVEIEANKKERKFVVSPPIAVVPKPSTNAKQSSSQVKSNQPNKGVSKLPEVNSKQLSSMHFKPASKKQQQPCSRTQVGVITRKRP